MRTQIVSCNGCGHEYEGNSQPFIMGQLMVVRNMDDVLNPGGKASVEMEVHFCGPQCVIAWGEKLDGSKALS